MKKKVEIFSTPSCHYCHMAKDWFTANKIEYVDYDVTTDKERRQELIDLGAMGVPLIRITDLNKNDEPIILNGFEEEKLAEIFNIK